MIEELPQQLHVVLGEEFKITCSATNDQDAPMKLTFSWRSPDGVDVNVTTHEGDSHTATSTLHVGRITRNHDGVYQCIVSNDGHQRINTSVISTVIVEGNYFTIFMLMLKYSYDMQNSHHHLGHLTLLM